MKSENPDREAIFPIEEELSATAVPPGVDRRTFMMRSAVLGSAAVIAGCTMPEKHRQRRLRRRRRWSRSHSHPTSTS